LYDRGGWIASGSYSMGSIGAALIVCSLRGPWEKRWFGWRGGWSIRKKTVSGATEERNHLRRLDTKEKLEDQEKRDNTQRDLERGEKQREEDLVHERGRRDQDAVNAMGVEQALEGLAAEDKTDAVYGEDKKPLSPESGSVKSVPVQEHRE
jgi:hypothetical protein